MNRQNLFNNFWLRFVFIVLVIGTLVLFFMSEINRKPILIGLSAQLTGRQAEMGVQVRNGVQLAVEKINASGGVAGRNIELIIRDDFGIPDKAKAADNELINSGVLAIIGHVTSAQTLAGLEVTNPAGVIMIGPNISTPALSGLDDNFLRVYPSFQDSARAFAQYVYQRIGITRMAVIYDTGNTAYARTYSTTFSDKFQTLGGKITSEVNFSSVERVDFSPILSKLRMDKPEGLLIIASDIDTALIAQRTRLMDWQIPLFTSAWAQTDTLIKNGGHAVEEMELEQSYALTSQSPRFLDFQSGYQARFGNSPSFGAAFGYEAALVLAAALEKTGGKSSGLKNALLETHDFPGLMDTFSLDGFGDVERPFYLSSIQNGKFNVVEKLTSTKP